MDDQIKKEILDMIFEMKKQINPLPIVTVLNEIKMNLDRIALRIDEEFYNKYYQNSSQEIKRRLAAKNEKTIRYLQEGGKIPLENDQAQ